MICYTFSMKEKVAIVRCPDYQITSLREAITRLLDLLGLSRTAWPSRVLFKPNMLSPRKPEEAVTTHPLILEALAEIIPSSILIGDSPANTARPVEEYWEKCGFSKIATRKKANLVRFDRPVFVSLQVKGKKFQIPVANYCQQMPLINLPKLKTHTLTIITGATKNLFGCIPGFQKSLLHRDFLSPEDLSSFLTELSRALKPNILFHLVDAITIMDGNGPSNGRVRNCGYLIAGYSDVAVDLACAKLLSIEPWHIPTLRIYQQVYGLPELNLVGDTILPLRGVVLPGISVSSGLLRLPATATLLSVLKPFFQLKPEIRQDSCQQCLACVKVCPVAAITPGVKIRRDKCISCLCCFEVCPHQAIYLKKSWLARYLT